MTNCLPSSKHSDLIMPHAASENPIFQYFQIPTRHNPAVGIMAKLMEERRKILMRGREAGWIWNGDAVGGRTIESLLPAVMIDRRPGDIAGCDILRLVDGFEINRHKLHRVGNLISAI